MSRPLSVAVIGCGRIAQYAHLPALIKARGVRVVAVCDVLLPLAEQVARRFGVASWYGDPSAVISSRAVDAVLLAVPDALHIPLAIQALEAGKHVLVEKPLGLDRKECLRLRETVERTGLKLQVGAMKRHDPGLEYAHAFLRDRLGAIVSWSAWYRASSFKNEWHATLAAPPIDPPASGRDAGKRDRGRYYLRTHGAHLFDGIRFLLGEVSHVTARLVADDERYVWHGLLELDSGALGHFDLAVPIASDWSEGFAVFGEAGSLSVRTHWPFFLRGSDVRAFDAQRREWSQPFFGDSDPYKRQVEAFAQAIARDLPTSPSIDDGIAAVGVIEAVQLSVSGGSRVRVAPY